MTSPVRRQYRSTLRVAQARQTRQAIVAASSRLFARDGFGATTIDAIADEAGVSRKTVFTAVGGKTELLKLALDWAISGDDEPVAVADRPEVRQLLRHPEPSALLQGWAKVLSDIDHRIAGLFLAAEIAAGIDPAAQSLFETARDQRLQGARMIVDRLTGLNALSSRLTRDQATDIAWLFSDPAIYDRLVRQRGWARDQFTNWLADTLCRELLTQPKNASASS
jgi:AcrR family transcriptional regulator